MMASRDRIGFADWIRRTATLARVMARDEENAQLRENS
jgi:hypothetical protein